MDLGAGGLPGARRSHDRNSVKNGRSGGVLRVVPASRWPAADPPPGETSARGTGPLEGPRRVPASARTLSSHLVDVNFHPSEILMDPGRRSTRGRTRDPRLVRGYRRGPPPDHRRPATPRHVCPQRTPSARSTRRPVVSSRCPCPSGSAKSSSRDAPLMTPRWTETVCASVYCSMPSRPWRRP